VEGKVDKSTQVSARARLIKRNVGPLICCLREDTRGDVNARPVASCEPGDATLGSGPLERRQPVRRVEFPVQPC